MPDDLRRSAVRRAAKGAGAQGLDAVGVGAGAEAAAGGVGAGRRPAGVGPQHRAGGPAAADGRAAPQTVPARRAGPAARSGVRRLARSTSPRAIRSTPTTTPTATTSAAALVAAGLPDARSPDLGGAYAHALKSVAVGPDGAVYFSIGSTGNISAEDRDGQPAARHHHAGPARRRSRRSRSRPACATAPGWRSRPTAAVWTAVNNRDNVAVPDRARRTARWCPTTSTTIRPSRSRS